MRHTHQIKNKITPANGWPMWQISMVKGNKQPDNVVGGLGTPRRVSAIWLDALTFACIISLITEPGMAPALEKNPHWIITSLTLWISRINGSSQRAFYVALWLNVVIAFLLAETSLSGEAMRAPILHKSFPSCTAALLGRGQQPDRPTLLLFHALRNFWQFSLPQDNILNFFLKHFNANIHVASQIKLGKLQGRNSKI